MPKQNSILRKQKTPYTTINNELINDKELYLRDKGLYIFMFSKPEGWSFSVRGLSAQVKEGKTSVSQSLKRLIERGWLRRHEVREAGKYITFEYEMQVIKTNSTVSRKTDTLSAKPDTEKRTLSKYSYKNKNSYKKKKEEKERDSTPDIYENNSEEIEAYINSVIENGGNIHNEHAYRKKLIQQFIKEDKATLLGFEAWLPIYRCEKLQKKYSGKHFEAIVNNERFRGELLNVWINDDGKPSIQLRDNEEYQTRTYWFHNITGLEKFLENVGNV
ncbi:MAG: hypothetical protein AB7S65_08145 [Sulfuricurvum sp.]